LINNRQGGRRRGRGGGRAPNMNVNGGSRQDNRQRGNAAQLLEKYKGLARDAQMQGDRVQTEYYLQFADHYFRVLSESRARFEEQRRQRDGDEADAEDGEDEPGTEGAEVARPRRERQAHDDRDDNDGDDERQAGNGRRARRTRGRQESVEDGDGEGEANGIALDALPPAISAAAGADGEDRGGEEAPRPRRRTRRQRDPGEDVAPAA